MKKGDLRKLMLAMKKNGAVCYYLNKVWTIYEKKSHNALHFMQKTVNGNHQNLYIERYNDSNKSYFDVASWDYWKQYIETNC